MMDIGALDHLLFSKVEMHIIPVNIAAAITFDFAETTKQLEDLHPVCDFLIRRWEDHMDGGRKERVIWDLALISGIIHPEFWEKELITTTADNGGRQIHFVKSIDAQQMRQEFFDIVRAHYSTND